MQRAWDKYLDFSFEIVEEVTEDLLDSREQHYIDLYYNDVDCMNLAKFVNSPTRGCVRSESAKEKARKTMRDMVTYNQKAIVALLPDGSKLNWASSSDAGDDLKVHSRTIRAWCSGKQPQPGTGKRLIKKLRHLDGWRFSFQGRA